MRFAKINEEGEITFAPNKLHYRKDGREIFIANPSNDILKEQGYLEVEETEMPEGNFVCRYEERDGKIAQIWEEIQEEEAIHNVPEEVSYYLEEKQ